MDATGCETDKQSKILSCERLNAIKDTIEELEKEQQVQVLQILKLKNIGINENKNGVFINLTNLDENVIEELEKFIEHLNTQEKILSKNEKLKNNYIETYFKENKTNKQDKDSMVHSNNGEI
tara:strand:- start:201 stop:566 length:366 start_codon:yes stop_codon:yes gene_type:complete